QFTFSIYPPAVTGQIAIASYDAVAWDGHGNVVVGASLGHGTHSFGRAYAFGDVGVADGDAWRDLTERAPDSFLEGRSLYIQWQVQANRGRFDEAHDLSDQLLEVAVAADDFGFGKLILQVTNQLIGIVAQQDGADAALALGYQNRS